MSKSQYETYEAYGPYTAPAGPPGGPWPGLHEAETVPNGVPYDDTYRPAYEAGVRAPASVPAHELATEPLLPRQSGDTLVELVEDTRPPDEDTLVQILGAEDRDTLVQDGYADGSGRAARRRRARSAERPESAVRRLLPQALVVAFLAGGTTAFVAQDKAVELSVDGRQRSLHTFADDVGELLAEEGVHVGAHDMVAPAPGTALAGGDRIAVRYGRPVRLTLDGHRHEVWTTAGTVEGALHELGVRAEGAYLSASRSQSIGRAGLALDVRTERAVTIMADGRARTVRTNAATVREAIEDAGITLRGQDTTSVPGDSFPRDGQTVTVLRVTGSREIREEQIPFGVRRTEDPSLFKGTEVVSEPGQPGLRRTTFLVRTVNGVRQTPRREKTEVVRRPRRQVVRVGTKPLPPSVHGADHLNWRALAACESGGRPHAVDASGTYGGLYQFDAHTWHSLGGRGRPQDAPAEEQTLRAKKLYVSRGATPWPACGRRLHG
ncbi:ubiquitin-like domain-containing protein [Streptomyces sp. NPDC059688]|uniref:Ubiquitin-like domain-containing protein n=1 Tax=Streptomyces albidocamelliae TaxID=2981135 RepID=A0ABY6ES88_9ACTN|nr:MULTISPECIES: resuscitation-promoting factor [unclassified Streptomyces]OKJ86415.1 transglycosylase [Streptomyces sp. CB01883]UXY37257.1 ubiquitin-like domain-containing protein [Streptomyces sp. HUAS 14-6]